jgi:CRP-like cAMP-binding protein
MEHSTETTPVQEPATNNMYDLFFKDFTQKAGLTQPEQDIVKTFLTPKKLRKRQYLLQEGDVCKAIAFIEKGALREYSLDEAGGEHIVQFGLEGWYISDMYSFLTGEPATYNIDAIEDAELVLITREAYEEMLRSIPRFETLMRINITGAYLALQRRLTASVQDSLEARYETFIRTYPNIVQRVPQHMIASYLGATPETLSRIRKRIANR